MALDISAPRADAEGLDDLELLWKELHRHHREVAEYPDLVQDLEVSWRRRRDLYRRLLAAGASYLTATSDDGQLIGYTMLRIEDGLDDTFDAAGGIAEVVTLVVSPASRSIGVGQALLRAAEDVVRRRGSDTLAIAVMTGNARAQRFYEANGYRPGEVVLYRRFDGGER